jgi:hypothetical protein
MRRLAKSALVLVVITLGVATVATAQTTDAVPGGAGPQGGFGGRGGFGRMGQPVQGTVTAVSGGKITIKTDAGDTYDVSPAANARVMKDREAIQISDIKAGDVVTAMGQVDTTKKTVEAMMIRDVDAATAAKAKENLGKTYITGRVTAIDADSLKITVDRPDKVSQVIAVDEGTSFQRGMRGVAQDIQAAGGMGAGFGGGFGGRGQGGGRQGNGQAAAPAAPESITLADIKTGDVIAATGSVKNGSFTAQKMGVMQPRAGMQPGQRGRRMGEGPGETAPPPSPPPQ